MNADPQRPLLFLDVDGTLIPFGAPPPATSPVHDGTADDPLLARLDPAVGRRLAALPCELVWATTWGAEANTDVGPRLGLPPLPVLEFTESGAEEERDIRAGRHWKTRAVLDRAAGRPFAWVDDEISDRDREWVAARTGERALLVRVDPRRGLTDAELAALERWLTRWT